MISSTIRYKYIKMIVNKLYVTLKIDSYPIDIFKIISYYKNIRIISYSYFMKKYNLTKEETLNCFSSKEGCTDYLANKDKYLIYYNDFDNKSKKRIYWTITHEFGHILCGHYSKNTRIFAGLLSDDEYSLKESEANYFACLLLSHPEILLQLNVRSSYDIEVFCSLSHQAATYRFNSYRKWCKCKILTSSDRYIIRNFKEFIDSQNEDYKFHLEFVQSFRR